MTEITYKITNVRFEESECIVFYEFSNNFHAAQRFPLNATPADMKAWGSEEAVRQAEREAMQIEVTLMVVEDGNSNQ
jgi:hypothetical protein